MRRVSGVRAGCPFVCGSVLELDRFWGPRLPASRQGTRWLDILKVLLCARVLASTPLYRCLDKLVVHKEAFCTFLHQRWTTMFNARFDILRYDLTSTDFESDPPFEDKRQFGDSRDKRSDCVQGVIALIVTPDGFPLAYEVMPGNPSDNTTLAGFAGEERAPIRSLRSGVGHGPRHPDRSHAGHDARRRRAGALSGSRSWRSRSWARPGKRCARASRSSSSPRKGSCTCLVHSESRGLKERSMRTRRLKKLWQRLHELRRQSNRRRPTPAQARLGQKGSRPGFAPGRYSCARDRHTGHSTNVPLRLAPRPAAPSAPTRRPRPVALQQDRGSPRDAMEI